LRGVDGASNVRVEQIAGLPVLEIAPDKAEIALPDGQAPAMTRRVFDPRSYC
jgi:hypothetical protein